MGVKYDSDEGVVCVFRFWCSVVCSFVLSYYSKTLFNGMKRHEP